MRSRLCKFHQCLKEMDSTGPLRAHRISIRGHSHLDLRLDLRPDRRRIPPVPITRRRTCNSLVSIRNIQDSSRTPITSNCPTRLFSMLQCPTKAAVALFWSRSRLYRKIQSWLTKHRKGRCASSNNKHLVHHCARFHHQGPWLQHQ